FSSISLSISSRAQAVVLGVSFTPLGNFPCCTPAHQVLLETGISLSTSGSLMKPLVFKTSCDISLLLLLNYGFHCIWGVLCLYIRRRQLGCLRFFLKLNMWGRPGFDGM